MTSPLDGYAVIDGTWYETGPLRSLGPARVAVLTDLDPEPRARAFTAWKERVAEMVRAVAPEPCPEDVEALVNDIVATLWETP